MGPVPACSEIAKPGDCLQVLVTAIEGNRFSASLRKLADNPWLHLPDQETILRAEVTMCTEYGAFVLLANKLYALLLNDDSFAKHSVGDTITVTIESSDPSREKIRVKEVVEVG